MGKCITSTVLNIRISLAPCRERVLYAAAAHSTTLSLTVSSSFSRKAENEAHGGFDAAVST
jgi:hypothetical protein